MTSRFTIPLDVVIIFGILAIADGANTYSLEVARCASPSADVVASAIFTGIGTAMGAFLGFYILWVIGKSIWLGCRRPILGMLGSVHAGERANAAIAPGKQLGCTPPARN